VSFFCLLWVPLFFLLRRSLVGGGNSSGSVWALILGSLTAILQFLLGYIVSPGGFGFSRWLFGFVDIVSLPVIIPLLACLVMLIFRSLSGDVDFVNFTLLWLIPVAALRALGWSSGNDPILLIIVPLLWTALAIGISFFINLIINNFRWYIITMSIFFIITLPVAAAGTYWAFFSQKAIFGIGLLLLTNIPLGLSLFFDIRGK